MIFSTKHNTSVSSFKNDMKVVNKGINYNNNIADIVESFVENEHTKSYRKFNIDDTVKKVERFLDDSRLIIKLTRGEIYDIVRNVSRKRRDHQRPISDNSIPFHSYGPTASIKKYQPMFIEPYKKINIDYSHLLKNRESITELPVTEKNNLPPNIIPYKMKHILSSLNLDQPVRYSSKYTLKPIITTTQFSKENLISKNLNDLLENIKAEHKPLHYTKDPRHNLTDIFSQISPDVNSYKKFKPLNLSKFPFENEMKKFLVSFGLVDKNQNEKKKIAKVFRMQKQSMSLPKTMENILNNIGIMDAVEVKSNSIEDNNGEFVQNNKFNRLALSKKIKRNENSIKDVTEEISTVDNIIDSLMETTESNILLSEENMSNTTKPNEETLKDLESSFGGNLSNEEIESTTKKPKTGFFYFVNWNSFLRVGEDDDPFESKVDLQFNPKKGNPERFLPSLL